MLPPLRLVEDDTAALRELRRPFRLLNSFRAFAGFLGSIGLSPMRRPLVIVAVLYACGLLLAEVATPPLIQLITAGFALAVTALFWERMRCWMLVPLVIVVGWANHTSRTAILSPHDLRLELTKEPVEVALRGSLAETPSVRMFIRDEVESYRTLAVIEVTEMSRGGKWIPAAGQVLTTTPGNLDGKMFKGTEVEVRGIIAPPMEPVAPGLFDYRSYLARQYVHGQLSVRRWPA